MGQIKLLIVDDSLFMQKILSDLLQSDKQISVVGTARDGEEALSKIASFASRCCDNGRRNAKNGWVRLLFKE